MSLLLLLLLLLQQLLLLMCRNCLLKRDVERNIVGVIEVTGKRGRRRQWMTLRKQEGAGIWKRKQ